MKLNDQPDDVPAKQPPFDGTLWPEPDLGCAMIPAADALASKMEEMKKKMKSALLVMDRLRSLGVSEKDLWRPEMSAILSGWVVVVSGKNMGVFDPAFPVKECWGQMEIS